MRSIRRVASIASRIDWQFVRRIRAVGRPLGSLSPARENRVRLALFLAAIAMVVAAFLLRDRLTLTQVGYGGIALASLIASAGLIIPVPALAAVCIGGALTLNPLIVGLVAGSAETLGELTGYFFGYSGQGMVQRSRLYLRLETWMRQREWFPLALLFLLSLVPNPVFDVVGLAAGALRVPVWKFLSTVWVGKTLKFLAVAYLCAHGYSRFFA